MQLYCKVVVPGAPSISWRRICCNRRFNGDALRTGLMLYESHTLHAILTNCSKNKMAIASLNSCHLICLKSTEEYRLLNRVFPHTVVTTHYQLPRCNEARLCSKPNSKKVMALSSHGVMCHVEFRSALLLGRPVLSLVNHLVCMIRQRHDPQKSALFRLSVRAANLCTSQNKILGFL